MNLVSRFSVFIIALCYIFSSYGQNITVKVKDTSNTGLIGAQVQLTRWQDSLKVYSATDKDGNAVFTNVYNGSYNVKVSYVGYLTLKDTLNITYAKRNFEFKLKTNSVAMGVVEVVAKKPMIRQEDDKMIVDPMPLINISSNALEVLEKTPGLYVDQDGNVYLNSATPAAIYINGKEQKMSTDDITTLLRSLPPGSIQKIEVMRTPSTKYDASTSGGIINIILKKGVSLGRTGSINIGMNQGFYGNRFAGFNVNNSTGKTTAYLNVNYNHNDMLEQITSVRSLSPTLY